MNINIETIEQLAMLSAERNLADVELVVKNHMINAEPLKEQNYYGTTLPQAWATLTNTAAAINDMKHHTYLKTMLEAIASYEEQLCMANKEGVTRSEIVRRLMVQAFPWLPEWKWKTRQAMRSTPKPSEVVKKERALDEAVMQRSITESRQVYDKDVYAELKALAASKDTPMSPDEYIKDVVTKQMRARIAKREGASHEE